MPRLDDHIYNPALADLYDELLADLTPEQTKPLNELLQQVYDQKLSVEELLQ